MIDLTGRSIAGRYDLQAQVGAGGAGAVYRAQDRILDRTVAIKLGRPGQDETARARLRAEARIAASLSHPGIAPILDYGEDLIDGEVSPYLVMQYVDGVTLRDVLRTGPLPPARVADLVAQLAEALAAAHAAGVVHRDVKPANIMLTAGGRAVLLDFGIARQADLDPLTVTGTIVGTVDYISPEQAAGEGATPRSDLYALGMVAHEALTGTRALVRDTQVATLLAHVTEDVEPLPVEAPAELRALVEQMVRRDPAQRPAQAISVARRARAAVTGGHVRDRVAAPPAPPRRRINRTHPVLTAVGVGAVLLAVLGVLLTRGNAQEASPKADVAKPHGTVTTRAVAPPVTKSPHAANVPAPGRATSASMREPRAATPSRAVPSRRHQGRHHTAKAYGKARGHTKLHHKGHGWSPRRAHGRDGRSAHQGPWSRAGHWGEGGGPGTAALVSVVATSPGAQHAAGGRWLARLPGRDSSWRLGVTPWAADASLVLYPPPQRTAER